MYNSTLTQCLQAALLDGYSFAEITRIGAHNCPYSYGAHITLLVDKLFWQMKWHDIQTASWDYYEAGFICYTNNPENFISLYKSVKHSMRDIENAVN
jgi:hypothetical protein